MWANYLGLWILFLFFIGLGIFIWLYSRWQIKGPVYKMKYKKMKAFVFRQNKGSVKVKKGEVVVDDKAIKDIEAKKSEINAAQEYLEVQGLETKLEKEKEKALKAYETKKDKKKKDKKKDKDDFDKEEIKGESIFEHLGEGDSAQDLLHQDDNKVEEIVNEKNATESVLDSLEIKKFDPSDLDEENRGNK